MTLHSSGGRWHPGGREGAGVDSRLLEDGGPHFFFYLLDPNGAVRAISRSVARITGRGVEDWLGQRHWFATDHPRNRIARELLARHLSGRLTGDPLVLEVSHADGRTLILETYQSGIFDDGRLVAVEGIAHDVTERERAEDRVALLAAAMRSTGDGICIADRDGIIRFVNDSFCSIFGRPREGLVGAGVASLRSSLNPKGALRHVGERTLAGGWRGDIWSERADGSVFLAELTTSMVADESDDPVAMIGIVRDVTETRRIEADERKRLRQLDLVNRIARHVASLRDQRSLLEAAVREIQQAFQFHSVVLLQVDEARGVLGEQVIAGAYEAIAPRDYTQPIGVGLIGEAARLGRTVVVDDVQSDPRWVQGFPEEVATRSELCVPIRHGDRVIAVLDVQETRPHAFDSSDVTTLETLADQIAVSFDNARLIGRLQSELGERRRAEEDARAERDRARRYLELAPVLFVALDPQGRVTLVNRRTCEVLGRSEAETLGRDWFAEFVDIADHDRLKPLFRRLAAGEAGAFEYGENAVLTADGGRRTIAWRNSVLEDASGAVIGTLSAGEDVTERRELEEQLRHAQRLEAVGRLAGGVAHDFNNLLQAIITTVELVRLQADEPRAVAGFADELEAHVRRGAALARQLLLFARRGTIRKQPLELNGLLNATSELLRRLLRENVRLGLELDGAELSVSGDRGQLEQVVTNLVLNAADAMPSGGEIRLRSGCAGEWTWFEVEDSGVGMEPRLRERIFEPFFTTKDASRGTGLGLSVVHGIVTRHRGQIEVHSEPGVGSRFRVLLPRADRAASPGGDSAPRHRIAHGSGESVLLVEDDSSVRATLTSMLGRLGYRVTAAASGEEAVAQGRSEPFDLLLSDVSLPGISGPEVARSLVERWPDLAVVLISGHAEERAVATDIASGGTRFLQKPVDLATLAREVRGALDGRPCPGR